MPSAMAPSKSESHNAEITLLYSFLLMSQEPIITKPRLGNQLQLQMGSRLHRLDHDFTHTLTL